MFGPYALAVGRGAHRHALKTRAADLALPIRVETAELLLVAGAGAAILAGKHSILVGQIFNGENERLDELPSGLESWAETPSSSPADLWGNFALFSASPEFATVYRDPSASVPVHRLVFEGQTIFASDAPFAKKLGLLEKPSLDERFVVHWLQFPFLRTRRTGLVGVEELLGGMALTRTREKPWREWPAWHPAAHTRTTIKDAAVCTDALRIRALKVVPIQAAGKKVALRLSGGLDSSIIACCLAKAQRNFPCINFATRSRDGDEREHAREVARTFRLDLIEVSEPQPSPLEVPGELSFRPLINPLLAPFEAAIGWGAQGLGASMFIDGGGGDNLFCSVSSAAPMLDALKGLSLRGSFAVARDIASRANCTIWEVAIAAARKRLRYRPDWNEDRSFLNPQRLLVGAELHPWLQDLPVPAGKREHVEALVHIQHFLDRGGMGIERLHPLLAQPLLELCLKIPTWLWLSGGRDRAVARDAFRGLVPDCVLDRRMKGSLQGMLYRSFSTLRETMRDLLVEGELAKRQLIDPRSIDQALRGDSWMADKVQLRISEMAALELWLRSWRFERDEGSQTHVSGAHAKSRDQSSSW